jgi:hypothetical protein
MLFVQIPYVGLWDNADLHQRFHPVSDPPMPIRGHSLSVCVQPKPILCVMPSRSRQRVVSTRTVGLYRHDAFGPNGGRPQPTSNCGTVVAVDQTRPARLHPAC